MIKREQLEVRRAALMEDYRIVVGHLQEVDYWLAQIGTEAEPAPAPGPEDPSTVVPEPEGETDGR